MVLRLSLFKMPLAVELTAFKGCAAVSLTLKLAFIFKWNSVYFLLDPVYTLHSLKIN